VSGDSLARISYDASARTLEQQERVLTELRARTGLLLAASSLAASFLGAPTLDDAEPVILVLGLLAFASSIGGCLYVLLPRPYAFTFSLIGSAVFEELYDRRDNPDEVYRRLVYQLDRYWKENDVAIQPLFRSFVFATVALVAEVVLLLGAASDTLFSR
jgi:hypothetical protein